VSRFRVDDVTKEVYYNTTNERSNLKIITSYRVARIITSDKVGSLIAIGIEVSLLLKDSS
jgi:hypothetical protein